MPVPTAQNRSLTKFFMKGIREGKIQLPEFQREFVWGATDQKELFESIINLHPVGSILLLEIDQLNPQFAWTSFHGVVIPENSKYGYEGEDKVLPQYLVLDGQQRLTTIAHMLIGNVGNVWYLWINRLYQNWTDCGSPQDADLENWLSELSLASHFITNGKPTDNPSRNFLGNHMKMPLTFAESAQSSNDKIRELRKAKEDSAASDMERAVRIPERADEYTQNAELKRKQADFVDVVIRRFLSGIFESQLPSVEIPKGMDIDGICKVFTKINTTGISLGAFDLCVAKLYPKNISLVNKFNLAMEDNPKTKAVDGKKRTLVLASTAMHSGKNPKTATLPRMITEEVFSEYWDTSVNNFEKACVFLTSELGASLDYGDAKYVPYPTILPPLSVLIGEFLSDAADVRVRQKIKKKLAAWCASAPIARRYADGTDVKQVKDLEDMRVWLTHHEGVFTDQIPQWMLVPNHLLINEILPSSAVGKTFIALLNQVKARDWYSEETVGRGDGRVASDIHHIFPKKAMREKVRQESGEGAEEVERLLRRKYIIDNIANLTWISQATNREYIRDRLPSDYIEELINHHASGQPRNVGRIKLLEILVPHSIDDSALSALEENDYEKFIGIRSSLLAEKYISKYDCYNLSLDGSEEE